MNLRIATCSLAVSVAFAAIPLTASAAPSVAFKRPTSGGTLTGSFTNSSVCEVTGSNIRQVRFYLDSTALNTESSSPWNCSFDTRKFSDGAHTLRAVAYDSSGATASTQIAVNINNGGGTTTPPPSGGTGSGSSTAASVVWNLPAEGGALRGNVQGPPNCVVTGTNIARVQFFINDVLTNTDGNLSNGLGCWIDTTKYKDGAYTLKAVAYNAAGQASAPVTRGIVIQNGTTTPPTPPTTPPPSGGTAPSVVWNLPAEGGALKGNVQGPPNCVVTGSNLAKVQFYINDVLTNTDGNLSNGLGCWIDTTKYKDGAYTLKAIGFNSAGQASAPVTRGIVIANSTTSGGGSGGGGTTTNVSPSVGFTAPTASATLSNTASCAANASDSDGSIAKVEFFVGTKLVGTDTSAPYQCSFDTKQFANGTNTLVAVATDNLGKSSSTQRSVTISNTVVSNPDPVPPTGGGVIDAADIIGQVLPDVPFSQHKGYSGQVIGQYPSASSIPESGINGSTLPNGETLRLGKVADPANSARRAMAFQLHPNDPATSGSKRAEISFSPNVEMEKTYWIAFKVFVPDWGNLSSSDQGLFGTQLHSGDNSAGYSPSFGIYTAGSTGRNFKIQVRGSGLSGTLNYAEQPIPFGRWVDFVFKFRQSTGSTGFVQAWMDGNQILNHSGPLGYKTSYKDYFKFGYYNWSGSFSSQRKVLMRGTTMVLDPTGSKYDAATLRAAANQ
jgi:hypothetical protein